MNNLPPQLEGGKPPVDKVKVAAVVTAALSGLANGLTLTGIIPVEFGTQVVILSTAIVPIVLGIASLHDPAKSKDFQDAAKLVQPGSKTTASYNRLTGKTTITFGAYDEKEMNALDKKLDE